MTHLPAPSGAKCSPFDGRNADLLEYPGSFVPSDGGAG